MSTVEASFKLDHTMTDEEINGQVVQDQEILYGTKSLPFNILLLGSTGSGKSCLINMAANYCRQGSWHDLKIVIPTVQSPIITEPDIPVKENHSELLNTALTSHSVTDKCGAYLYLDPESGLWFKIWDTPGIGDTRGLDTDKRHIDNILETIKNESYLHGICLVINGTSCRSTQEVEYVLGQILASCPDSSLVNIFVVLSNVANGFVPNLNLDELSHRLQCACLTHFQLLAPFFQSATVNKTRHQDFVNPPVPGPIQAPTLHSRHPKPIHTSSSPFSWFTRSSHQQHPMTTSTNNNNIIARVYTYAEQQRFEKDMDNHWENACITISSIFDYVSGNSSIPVTDFVALFQYRNQIRTVVASIENELIRLDTLQESFHQAENQLQISLLDLDQYKNFKKSAYVTTVNRVDTFTHNTLCSKHQNLCHESCRLDFAEKGSREFNQCLAFSCNNYSLSCISCSEKYANDGACGIENHYHACYKYVWSKKCIEEEITDIKQKYDSALQKQTIAEQITSSYASDKADINKVMEHLTVTLQTFCVDIKKLCSRYNVTDEIGHIINRMEMSKKTTRDLIVFQNIQNRIDMLHQVVKMVV